MLIKLSVTQDHIDEGIKAKDLDAKGLCSGCPYALALADVMNGEPGVGHSHWWNYNDVPKHDRENWLEQPEEMCRRRYRFDQTGLMEPHSIMIDIPDSWLKEEVRAAQSNAEAHSHS